MSRNEKFFAAAFSIFLCCAVVLPVRENFADRPSDDFPFSSYPMFNGEVREHVIVNHFYGFDQNGQKHLLPARWLSMGAYNQTKSQLREYISSGRSKKVCARMLRRTKTKWNGESPITHVQFVSATYDTDAYFRGNTEPIEVKVRAECILGA
ncbi:MAG: hypothetical protein AB7T49_10805 [Oligoflexales bacterium]